MALFSEEEPEVKPSSTFMPANTPKPKPKSKPKPKPTKMALCHGGSALVTFHVTDDPHEPLTNMPDRANGRDHIPRVAAHNTEVVIRLINNIERRERVRAKMSIHQLVNADEVPSKFLDHKVYKTFSSRK